MLPLIILCGNAGAGKDTYANRLTEVTGGVSLGQADPLKLIARDIFQFTDDQLFGPSHFRNAPDLRYTNLENFGAPQARLSVWGPVWCQRIFPQDGEKAYRAMGAWFQAVKNHFFKTQELTPRYVLQTLGTEWGRSLDPDVWVKYAREVGLKLLGGGYDYSRTGGLVEVAGNPPPRLVVITDGRFPNEVVRVKEVGGIAIQVVRPGSTKAEALAAGVQGHASETSLDIVPVHFYDAVVRNTGGMQELGRKVDSLIAWAVMGTVRPPVEL